MKYISIILLFVLVSCSPKVVKQDDEMADSTQARYMSYQLTENSLEIDSLRRVISNRDSVITLTNSICDTLKTQLFLSNYKVEKVRFYLNICLKNPTQDKFLKGWVKRAIE